MSPVEVWRVTCDKRVEKPINWHFTRMMETEKMPEEWRKTTLALVYKKKGGIYDRGNYRGIKLMFCYVLLP